MVVRKNAQRAFWTDPDSATHKRHPPPGLTCRELRRAGGKVHTFQHPGGCRVRGYLTGHTALGSLLEPAMGFNSSTLR